jgi:hypothetical protein
MQPNLPLREMTRNEKLVAMDQIWEDLMKNPDDIPSPDWHKEVLAARSKRIESGESEFKDWETSKIMLRDEFE